MGVNAEQEFLDGFSYFIQLTVNSGMPGKAGYEDTRLRRGTTYTKFEDAFKRIGIGLDKLVDITQPQAVQLRAYHFIIDFLDFVLVCSCSKVWKDPFTRIHVLDDLHTLLLNRYQPRDHVEWSHLPARIHKTGFVHMLPALAAGIYHTCLLYSAANRNINVAVVASFLSHILRHVMPSKSRSFPPADRQSPTVIVASIIDGYGSSQDFPPTPATATSPLLLNQPTGSFYPEFQTDPDTSQIMEECTAQLRDDPNLDQFKGWAGAIWLWQVAYRYKTGARSSCKEHVKAELEKCYHQHLSKSRSSQVCREIKGEIDRTPMKNLCASLDQGSRFFRVHYTGDNVYRASQTDKSGSHGRYTLSRDLSRAGTLYMATDETGALAETFDGEPTLTLPKIVDRSIARIKWNIPHADVKVLSIRDADTRSESEREAFRFELLPWDRTQEIAQEAYKKGYHGIFYKSAKGIGDFNIALFSFGPQPSVPGTFTMEQSKNNRLVNSRQFWQYIKSRDKNTVCFTRLPDDIKIKPTPCKVIPGLYTIEGCSPTSPCSIVHEEKPEIEHPEVWPKAKKP